MVTAIAGPLVWGALSGMEVSLAALLVTAALVSHTDGREWTAALLLGLAALARPEAVLLVALVWMARPITRRRTAIFVMVPAACLGPWVLFNLVTAGTPLPATASAKIEGGLIGFLSGTRESATTFLVRPWQFEVEWLRWLWSVNVLLPLVIPVGLWLLWRRWGRAVAFPAAVLLLHPIAMALLAPYRGPGFQEGRYSIHLLPLAIAVAVAGLGGLARWPRLGAAGAAVLLLAAVAAAPPAADRYAWAVQNIDAMQVQVGRWVAARGGGSHGTGHARDRPVPPRRRGRRAPVSRADLPRIPDHLPGLVPRAFGDVGSLHADPPDPARPQHGGRGGRDGGV